MLLLHVGPLSHINLRYDRLAAVAQNWCLSECVYGGGGILTVQWNVGCATICTCLTTRLTSLLVLAGRYYPLLVIVIQFALAISGREFGPMLW